MLRYLRQSPPKFFLVLALVVYFCFGFYHLRDFIAADEHYWLHNVESDRIHRYWSAVFDGDWKETRVNDKPGITLAWSSIPSMLLENNPKDVIVEKVNQHTIFNPDKVREISLLYRLPILLISGFFSFYFFWILKRIVEDEWVALWSAILILLSPVLLGMSQIVNPDSLFWIFAVATIFTFLAYLKENRRKLAVLSGLFLGLALASKYVAIILFPFLFLMIAAYYLFNLREISPDEWPKRVRANLVAYVLIMLGAVAIFSVMMPAVFVEPKYLYEGTIGFPGMDMIFWSIMAITALTWIEARFNRGRWSKLIFEKLEPLKNYLPRIFYLVLAVLFVFILFNWLSHNSLSDFTNIQFDLKRHPNFGRLPYLVKLVSEALPLVFSLTPTVLFLLLFLWIKEIARPGRHSLLIFLLSSFMLVFYAAVIEQGLQVTIRYSIMLYPLVMVLASIALREIFFASREQDMEKRGYRWIFILILSGVIVTWFFSYIHEEVIPDSVKGNLFISYVRPIEYVFFLAVIGLVLAVFWISNKFFDLAGQGKVTERALAGVLIAVSAISLYLIAPFYFNYTNSLLPKRYIIVAAWGYGGYEAAEWLNSQPNAKDLTVWADAHGVCEFFVGKCLHRTKVNTDIYHIDYFVFSLRGQLRPAFDHQLEPGQAWELEIDGRSKNYIKIFKSQ